MEDAPMHGSEAITLSKLRSYINSHQPIPIEMMVTAFNTAATAGGDSQYRRAAETVMPEAAIYLHPVELSWFISARGSDDEARESIRHRKAYIIRAASLIPVLLTLLDVKEDSNLQSILRRVDDFCLDFAVIKATPHEKTVRKTVVRSIRRLTRAVADLAVLLDEFGHHIDTEFNHHKEAVARALKSDRFKDSFEPFRSDLKRLALAAEIVLYRESVGDRGFFVTDNKTKTQAVGCTYELSLWQGAPAFVTTPGSDFATAACSLVYEIASGERDVSLAGAINRFARSAARTEILEEEKSFRWDNSDEGMRAREADNFANVRERTSELRSEATFWDNMLQSHEWDAFSRRELLDRKVDVLEQLERTLLENGPHLVWGDQVRRAYGSSYLDLEETHDRLLRAEIALGQARRRSRDA
jgi:hypothetical protein